MLRRKLVFMLAACLLITGLALSVQEAAKTKDANDSEVFRRYIEAAEQGDPNAQFLLGGTYRKGEGVPQDYKEAAKWYTKAAEQGDAIAQFHLGYMYQWGEGVPQDYREAAKWWTKAAEQGNAIAQFALGYMYFQGQGVSQDYREAAKWYTKAAEQGDAIAQRFLASMYWQGQGVLQDYKEAVKWWTKAAEQGNAIAQGALGTMYRKGEGVRQDYKEAAKWLTKAAEQGGANAQFLLGSQYEEGQGVPQDYKEAVKWYTQAAEEGNPGAQFSLGSMYRKGEGVLEDYTEAYKWFLLAGSSGVDTQSLRSELRKKMTPSQIEEAQRRARAFLDRHEHPSMDSAERQARVTATASGFLITADGYLLTACHAVEKIATVEVLCQRKTYPAEVIVQDEATDIAVLKIDGSGFACLPLVSSATAKTGDAVFTMGFPQVALQGAEPKFTEGSISALSGLAGSPRFFQISVPVQPGNSGGPLVNEKGEVIGVIVSRLDDIATLLATGSVPQTVNYALKSSFILPLIESVLGLAEKLPKASAKDRSAAIENARKAVVLVVGYYDGNKSDGPSLP